MSGLSSLRKLAALLALMGLGALVVWLQEFNQTAPHARLPEEHGEPEYFVEQAHLTRFDAQGLRIQTLKSIEVTHYPDSDITLFEAPLLHHYSPEGQIWRVVAKHAEYSGENDIYLENKVVITPLNPDSAYLPEFLTERLWVNSLTNQAHTPDLVDFISPGGKTTGQGFQLFMDTGQAEIQQEVKGHYLPLPAEQETKL